jgi:hypothetical protein
MAMEVHNAPGYESLYQRVCSYFPW